MTKETTPSFQDIKKASFKPHTNCRVCNSTNLIKYLDLGLMPLPNSLEFTNTQAKAKERFPLEVMFCGECSLSQLSVVVDPSDMFSYYTYRSSINGGYVKHCKEMAYRLKNKYNLNEDSFCIDIAGNDGALLKEFKTAIGCEVLNVDPAYNLCKIAQEEGIDSINTFWNLETATYILKDRGRPDVITATNVFAHVDNVKEFLTSARKILSPDGVLILEFPYIIDFIEGFEMDTVYFEHLSYFSVLPLMRLCADNAMKIVEVEKFKIHGGTVRITISRAESTRQIEQNVWDFVKAEMNGGYGSPDKYLAWAEKSMTKIKDFRDSILKLKAEGNKIWAFAASAKGNTLLNCAGITSDEIEIILDETPEKMMKYSSGTGIQIAPLRYIDKTSEDYKATPDYIVILSWNFAYEIMAKLRGIGYEGQFIIPIPEFKVVD